MSLSNKLSAFFITLMFSNCTFAVIVESGFSNRAANESALEKYDTSASQSRTIDNYENNNSISLHANFASHEAQKSDLNFIAADQNFSILPNSNVYDNIVGYAGFENSGIASRADYHGWMTVSLSNNKADTEETVSVSEPSPILLFFGPLIFILWRAGLLPRFKRKTLLPKSS